MTLESETSTPDPPNPDQVIDSDYETETTEKLIEDYYEGKINHNYPNFQIIKKILKEERKALHARINLFNKSNPPYSSIKYLFIAKVAGV